MALWFSALALGYSVAQYCCPVWARSAHTDFVDVQLNYTMHLITETLHSAPLSCLLVLANIQPPAHTCKAAMGRLIEKTALHEDWLLTQMFFSTLQLSAIMQIPLDRHSSHASGNGKVIGSRPRWSTLPLSTTTPYDNQDLNSHEDTGHK